MKAKRRQSEPRFVAALAALYAAIAIIYLVLPIAGRFDSVLLGSQRIPGDSLLGSAILEWGFRSLWSARLHFFEWNAGFPVHNSLAITENLVGWQIIYSPLRFAGVGVAAAYNVVLLVSLIVSGVGAAMLARRLDTNRSGAALAGLVFAVGPYHLANLMNIATMSICWAPLAICFFDLFLERADVRDGIGLVASFLMTAFSGIYFGVFLVVILVVYAALSWVFQRHRFNAVIAGKLGIVAIVGAVLFSPVAFQYLQFAKNNPAVERLSASELAGLSLSWFAPIRTPEFQVAWSQTPLMTELWNASPAFVGIVALALILSAIVLTRGDVETRGTVLLLIGLITVAYVLALGPYFTMPARGSPRVVAWIPMPGRLWLATPGIRWSSRIYFFGWLGGAILAGIGLMKVQQLSSPRFRMIVTVAAISLIVLEYFPSPSLASGSVSVTEPLKMSDAYPYLASESDRGGVIELPITGPKRNSAFIDRFIYGSSGHLRHIVALHGGRELSVTDSLLAAGQNLPRDSDRLFLSSHGVTRVVVHRLLGDTISNAKLIQSLEAGEYPKLFDGSESAVFSLVH